MNKVCLFSCVRFAEPPPPASARKPFPMSVWRCATAQGNNRLQSRCCWLCLHMVPWEDEESENLKRIFELCKENLQTDTTGVIKGDKVGKENWRSRQTDQEFTLKFLKAVGVFEIPPPDCGEVTLTARHLSFIEFLAAAGILLSSDIESELGKIENTERFMAVTVYIRNDLNKNLEKYEDLFNFLFS